jgi:hypothetical protein
MRFQYNTISWLAYPNADELAPDTAYGEIQQRVDGEWGFIPVQEWPDGLILAYSAQELRELANFLDRLTKGEIDVQQN